MPVPGGTLLAALIVLLVLQAAGFAALYYLFVEHGRLLLRLEKLETLRDPSSLQDPSRLQASGLAKGSVLSDFSLETLAGGSMTLSQHRGRRVVLVAVNLDCAFSREFLTEWSRVSDPAPDSAPSPLVLCQGDLDAARGWFDQHPLCCPVLIDAQSAVSSGLRLPGTPTGYVIDEHGATASELLVGAGALWSALGASRRGSLVSAEAPRFSRSTERSRLVRDGLKKGTPAPHWSLTALDGTTVALKDFLGSRVLLVFSDPQCQPCLALAPALERLQRRSPDLSIVMISRGDPEENRRKAAENELGFTIVLQRHWEISRAYGMFATPVAWLIDRAGLLASDVAVGGDAILRLIDGFETSLNDDRPMVVAS